MPKKIFVVALMGPVGSGKSYVARRFAKKLGAICVRTDDIRVGLRKEGRPFSSAPRIARQISLSALKKGRSVVFDFDAVSPRRQKEIKGDAKQLGAMPVFIRVKTPEKIIIQRLKKHKYGARDLFKNADEAIRVYFIRRKLHAKKLQRRSDFVINNVRPLGPQIEKIVRVIKGRSINKF